MKIQLYHKFLKTDHKINLIDYFLTHTNISSSWSTWIGPIDSVHHQSIYNFISSLICLQDLILTCYMEFDVVVFFQGEMLFYSVISYILGILILCENVYFFSDPQEYIEQKVNNFISGPCIFLECLNPSFESLKKHDRASVL